MSNNKQSKRGPAPVLRNRIIVKLRELKQATSADLGVTTAFLTTLEKRGIVRVVARTDPRGSSGKGRKSNVYKLTASGNGKASSLLRKAA